jgi:hypothetical protein
MVILFFKVNPLRVKGANKLGDGVIIGAASFPEVSVFATDQNSSVFFLPGFNYKQIERVDQVERIEPEKAKKRFDRSRGFF